MIVAFLKEGEVFTTLCALLVWSIVRFSGSSGFREFREFQIFHLFPLVNIKYKPRFRSHVCLHLAFVYFTVLFTEYNQKIAENASQTGEIFNK